MLVSVTEILNQRGLNHTRFTLLRYSYQEVSRAGLVGKLREFIKDPGSFHLCALLSALPPPQGHQLVREVPWTPTITAPPRTEKRKGEGLGDLVLLCWFWLRQRQPVTPVPVPAISSQRQESIVFKGSWERQSVLRGLSCLRGQPWMMMFSWASRAGNAGHLWS